MLTDYISHSNQNSSKFFPLGPGDGFFFSIWRCFFFWSRPINTRPHICSVTSLSAARTHFLSFVLNAAFLCRLKEFNARNDVAWRNEPKSVNMKECCKIYVRKYEVSLFGGRMGGLGTATSDISCDCGAATDPTWRTAKSRGVTNREQTSWQHGASMTSRSN